jgi:tetratricopeptide (TPR) repeat protein
MHRLATAVVILSCLAFTQCGRSGPTAQQGAGLDAQPSSVPGPGSTPAPPLAPELWRAVGKYLTVPNDGDYKAPDLTEAERKVIDDAYVIATEYALAHPDDPWAKYVEAYGQAVLFIDPDTSLHGNMRAILEKLPEKQRGIGLRLLNAKAQGLTGSKEYFRALGDMWKDFAQWSRARETATQPAPQPTDATQAQNLSEDLRKEIYLVGTTALVVAELAIKDSTQYKPPSGAAFSVNLILQGYSLDRATFKSIILEGESKNWKESVPAEDQVRLYLATRTENRMPSLGEFRKLVKGEKPNIAEKKEATKGPVKNTAAGHKLRGDVLADGRDFKGALAEYERALTIDPNYAQAHLRMGDMHKSLGNIGEAERSYCLACLSFGRSDRRRELLGLKRAENLRKNTADELLSTVCLQQAVSGARLDWSEPYKKIGVLLTSFDPLGKPVDKGRETTMLLFLEDSRKTRDSILPTTFLKDAGIDEKSYNRFKSGIQLLEHSEEIEALAKAAPPFQAIVKAILSFEEEEYSETARHLKDAIRLEEREETKRELEHWLTKLESLRAEK